MKPEAKGQEKPTATSSPKKDETDKYDLIKIVSSEDKEIPNQAPPFEDILYDFIPESELQQLASKDDHVSRKEDSGE